MVNFACAEEVSVLEGTGERRAGWVHGQARDFPRGTGRHTLTYTGPGVTGPAATPPLGWLRLMLSLTLARPPMRPCLPHAQREDSLKTLRAECMGKRPLRCHGLTLSYSAIHISF